MNIVENSNKNPSETQNLLISAPEVSRSHRLTSGRLLARNSIWNLLGNGAPLLVAVLCIPILIRELGKDRFGVLTLVWSLIGYASLFDLGLGRALTQLVARKLGIGDEQEIPALAWTSLFLMTILGVVGSVVIALISPWLVTRILNIHRGLHREIVFAFQLMGLSVPFVITTAGLRGLLEAHQKFRLTSALRIPIGVSILAGPLAVLPFSKSLVPVVATLLAVRIFGFMGYLLACFRVVPKFHHSITWRRDLIRPLLSFGGWMTVSNLISPMLVSLDRFLIGAMVSMTAVAYYASPYEVVTKFSLLPAALMGVMFPAFSTGYAQNRERTARLFGHSVKVLFLVLFPVTLFAVVLAQDGLRLWLGADFAHHSYRVLQWLAIGVFMNSMALVPYTLLQGAGRPDVTAKLHTVELVLYVVVLWWMVHHYGIEGAALAWTARMTFDATMLFPLSRKLLFDREAVQWKALVLPLLALITLATATFLNGPIIKGLFLFATILIFALIMWFRILGPEKKIFAQSYR